MCRPQRVKRECRPERVKRVRLFLFNMKKLIAVITRDICVFANNKSSPQEDILKCNFLKLELNHCYKNKQIEVKKI